MVRNHPPLGELVRCIGMGSICHVEPAGCVPSLTNVDVRSNIVPLDMSMRESLAKSMGVRWKVASLRSLPAGASRYCQPPPCCAATEARTRNGGQL